MKTISAPLHTVCLLLFAVLSPAAALASDGGGEEAEGYSNKIRWTTASEVENFGFDVYRAESEDGPFEVLTDEPLEGGGTVDEPRQYLFVDDTIDPSKVYYYYVESISMSGVRERFTPVVRAKAKLPSADASADDQSTDADGSDGSDGSDADPEG